MVDKFYNLLKRNLNRGSGSIELSLKEFPSADISATAQLALELHKYAFLSEFKYYKSPLFLLKAKINRIPKAINFLSGDWLEIYVRQTVLNTLHEILPNEDISYIANPQILLPNGKDFEIDLIIRVNNDDNVIWIESKTGGYQNYINKYSDIKKIFGVKDENAFLVLSGEIDESELKNVSEVYGVNIVNLKGIKDKIHEIALKLK